MITPNNRLTKTLPDTISFERNLGGDGQALEPLQWHIDRAKDQTRQSLVQLTVEPVEDNEIETLFTDIGGGG